MKKNILITGGSGFLGRELIHQLLSLGEGVEVTTVYQSEKRICDIKQKFTNVNFYCADIASDWYTLDHIVKKHNIQYIIHCAAMKHVDICEKNPYRAVEVNIYGSKNIIDLFQKNNMKNLIGISTDKAINPSCTYGSTKYLMEKIFLDKRASVYRGVNFLFSDGSVLDIWTNQMNKGLPLSINKTNTTRFFISSEMAANKIIENLDTKEAIITPNECYKIELHNLAKAFCKANNYYHTAEYENINNVEKIVEDISEEIKIIDTDVDFIVTLLQDYHSKKK